MDLTVLLSRLVEVFLSHMMAESAKPQAPAMSMKVFQLISNYRKSIGLSAILIAVLLHAAMLANGAIKSFPNIDELGHLPAGTSHLLFQRFDMYRVNPPLVRTVAAFGVDDQAVGFDWSRYTQRSNARPEFIIGFETVRRLGMDYGGVFLVPRLLCIPFSIVGMLLLAHWMWRSFGIGAAVCVSYYWAFSPSIIAHGQTICPDVATMSAMVCVCFAFHLYYQQPNFQRLLGVGLLTGICLLVKMTWVILLPLGGLVILCLHLFDDSRRMSRRIAIGCLQVSGFAVIAILVLNAGYAFESTLQPLKDYEFCSQALGGENAAIVNPANRFVDSWAGSLRVPVPANWLLGMDFLRAEVEEKKMSYLAGQWKEGGWWYYYLLTVFYKTPLPTLAAALLGGILLIAESLAKQREAKRLLLVVFLGIPALFAFGSISSQTGFNHHHRYVLFVYPVLFVLAASLSTSLYRRRLIRIVSLVLLCGSMYSSISVAPYHLSYFNGFAGGPYHGWKVLGNSNVDWGQDLYRVKHWVGSKRAESERNRIIAELNFIGLKADFLGGENEKMVVDAAIGDLSSDEPKYDYWVVASANCLNGDPRYPQFEGFDERRAHERICYSFFAFPVTAAELLTLTSD